VAKRAPNLNTLGDFLDWLERQVFALGVDVRLNTYVEADEILAENPDVVIVATGGMNTGDGRQTIIPGELPPGMALPHVYDPVTLLTSAGRDFSGLAALVFDDVGRYDAIAAAEFLQQGGAAVTFVTSLGSFAPKMLGTSRDTESLMRLNKNGSFRLMVNTDLASIEKGAAFVRPRGAQQNEKIASDITVVVTPQVPVRHLFDELRERIPSCHLVGDALSPRDLLAAIHDGHRIARTV